MTIKVSVVGSGHVKLSYLWQKDGNPITESEPEYSGINKAELTISSFQHKHQGCYNCKVTVNDESTQESKPVKLKLSKA